MNTSNHRPIPQGTRSRGKHWRRSAWNGSAWPMWPAGYIDKSRAPATIRAYANDCLCFATWFDGHNLRPLPAAPATVAGFFPIWRRRDDGVDVAPASGVDRSCASRRRHRTTNHADGGPRHLAWHRQTFGSRRTERHRAAFRRFGR